MSERLSREGTLQSDEPREIQMFGNDQAAFRCGLIYEANLRRILTPRCSS